MTPARDIERVKKAKARLAEEIGDEPWCTGIGIAPAPDGGFALRVNVDPARLGEAEVPRTFEGFAVEVVEIEGYEPRA